MRKSYHLLSGLEVEFRYTDVPIGEVYSAGSEVVAGYIVDEIALQKNSSDIFSFILVI